MTIEGQVLASDQILLGYAHSTAYKGLPDFGWTLIVLTPEDTAFAAVSELLRTLIVLLAVFISARRAHLVRATKLAAVGEMTAKLAHEVRTPLGITRSSAQSMRRQDRLDEAERELMSIMINECDRINALVTSLLETARQRMPDIQREDLNAIVRRALELVRGRAAERQVDVIFQPGRELPACACDRNQIMQVCCTSPSTRSSRSAAMAMFSSLVPSWRRKWEQVIPFFAFSRETRRVIYMTNAIESRDKQVPKTSRNKANFPSDDAATKLIYLAVRQIEAK